MTSDRSYRPALSHDEAKHRLAAGAGTHFDSQCVRAFLALELDSGTAGPVAPTLDLPVLGAAGSPAA